MNRLEMNVLCQYTNSHEAYHNFVFHDASREAVEQWAHHIEQLQLQRRWYNLEQVKLLIDARQVNNLPIRYLFEMLSDYNRAYPDLKPPKVKMAYVHHPQDEILDIYRMFAELLKPPVAVEFFTDVTEAKQWLA